MTNGEKLCIDFPDMHYTLSEKQPRRVVTTLGVCASFDLDWWNAEYKEPTTKNDLGVDCIVDVLGSYTDLDIPYKREIAENILTKLSSVTPQEPKKGHWISTETKGVRYAFWCRYKCSLCGGLSDRTNFCPNCGAKMVEPQESEEE